MIRGDLRRAVTTSSSGVVVAIGRYCILCKGTVIRPPCRTYKGVFSYYPSRFGDHVFIGENTIVKSASVGNHVYIGKNCIIVSWWTSTCKADRQGQFAILKDCCRITDNTVIAPNTVVPSFSVYDGNPGRFVAELPECTQELYEAHTKEYYQNFQPA